MENYSDDEIIYTFDENNRIISSKTPLDIVYYFYDSYGRIYYEESYMICDTEEKLLRKTWLYYHPEGYMNHMVSNDGAYDIWFDRDGNETHRQL